MAISFFRSLWTNIIANIANTIFHNPAHIRVSCQQPRSRSWHLIDSITRKHGKWNFLVTRTLIALVIEPMHRKKAPKPRERLKIEAIGGEETTAKLN